MESLILSFIHPIGWIILGLLWIILPDSIHQKLSLSINIKEYPNKWIRLIIGLIFITIGWVFLPHNTA